MKYDFDTLIDRRGTGSYKWDSAEERDVIPMWVADMDFRVAPPIVEALEAKVKEGIFGYTYVPEDFYAAVIEWFQRRHGWEIKRDSILYTSGVVPAISAIIKALCRPGDGVLVQTPVYNCFFSSIRNNGCEVIENRLIYNNGIYSIDFEDFEKKISGGKVKIFLLCNPHNPSGRVWSVDELKKLGDICKKHNIPIVSDDIHCELVYPGFKYTPIASLFESKEIDIITCVSSSKSFNTAGLQIACIITDNDEMRAKIDRAININEVCDVNPFGVAGLIAAYRNGLPWLEQLVEYLHENYKALREFFEERMPYLKIIPIEATYLVWVDCSALNVKSQLIEDHLLANSKVWINAGTHYGAAGEKFIRINIATSRTRLMEGLERIHKGIESIRELHS
ncbi:MAG: pyridoxal phosphate-dependent aminotransferase [Paramuribaculum sp.]|nr:pyridoxal phosphate-dependent aminotransferase [Paramuribaculum sp.]